MEKKMRNRNQSSRENKGRIDRRFLCKSSFCRRSSQLASPHIEAAC